MGDLSQLLDLRIFENPNPGVTTCTCIAHVSIGVDDTTLYPR